MPVNNAVQTLDQNRLRRVRRDVLIAAGALDRKIKFQRLYLRFRVVAVHTDGNIIVTARDLAVPRHHKRLIDRLFGHLIKIMLRRQHVLVLKFAHCMDDLIDQIIRHRHRSGVLPRLAVTLCNRLRVCHHNAAALHVVHRTFALALPRHQHLQRLHTRHIHLVALAVRRVVKMHHIIAGFFVVVLIALHHRAKQLLGVHLPKQAFPLSFVQRIKQLVKLRIFIVAG